MVVLGIISWELTRVFNAKTVSFTLVRYFSLSTTYRTFKKWILPTNVFENVNTIMHSKPWPTWMHSRYGDSPTNQNRRRLGVCKLRLQPVNIQTSCQSFLRHSKQSEELRINTIVTDSALLFQSGIFVTKLGLHVPFVTSKDAWFARGRTIMAAFVCGVWRFRWNSAQAPWKTWHL